MQIKTKLITQDLLVFPIVVLAIMGVVFHSAFGLSSPGYSGHAVGSDDAYISFRYAENFFNGYGLVFNPGERVEGYSNFLYTILMVPAFLVSRDFVYIYTVIVNCAILSVTIYALFEFVKESLDSKNKALVAAFLLAVNPWVWANAGTGLETTLILGITTFSWFFVERYIRQRSNSHLNLLVMLTVLSMLSRVDGFLLPLVICCYAIIKKENRLAMSIFATIAIVAFIYTIFRIFYYDDIISNTYYNKISGNIFPRIKSGIEFVVEYSKKTGLWVPVALIIIRWLFGIFNKRERVEITFPVLFIPIWLAYLIWIGGDIYLERFLVALIPMGIYVTLTNVFKYARGGLQQIAVLFVFFTQSIFAFDDGRFSYELSAEKYDGWIMVGEFLGEKYPGKTIAVDAAGKIPYFSNLKTIDMLGLNDKHIGKLKVDNKEFKPGHQKFDPVYILNSRPDIIAAWVDENKNLRYGLDAVLYKSQYKLKYIVNLRRHSELKNNIIDVWDKSDEDIKGLLRGKEYSYGILIRK